MGQEAGAEPVRVAFQSRLEHPAGSLLPCGGGPLRHYPWLHQENPKDARAGEEARP